MSSAFVFDSETILCTRSSDGWWPLTIALPSDDPISSAIGSQPIYQIGRVSLAESLAPHHWMATDTISSDHLINASVASAITYSYAIAHDIELPQFVQDISVAGDAKTADPAFIPYRQLITQMPAAVADQLSQAIQLLRWQADTQFCSRCSAAVNIAQSGERSMICSVCRLRQYPRVQPCVITAITRDNPITGEAQILLAHHHRYGQSSHPLQYGLIAGFVEVGESLEHAVVREVFEEVGIRLKHIRYISSQPWPFPSNLMLGFRATHDSGEIVIQEDELSHAEFFDISNLPKIPSRGSIAYELIAQIVSEHGISL